MNDPNQEDPDQDQNQQNLDQQDGYDQGGEQLQNEEDQTPQMISFWEYVMQREELIQNAWTNLVGKDENDRIDSEGAQNFIDEITMAIQQQCEDCKTLFNPDGEIFQDDNYINYETFMEQFERWAREQPDVEQQQDTPLPQGEQGELNPPPEPEPEHNIYKQHNRMMIERFLKYHNKSIEAYFVDYSKEKQGVPKVPAVEIPLVMRIAFYIDNITFHKTKEDPDEFFNHPDSFKIVLAQLDSFLQQTTFSENMDVNTYKLNYVQFLQFVDFFITKEANIFLRIKHENEFDNQNLNMDNTETDLEKEIKQNISKYEDMLQNSQQQSERIVINNMLSALYDQMQRIQQVKFIQKTHIDKVKSPQRQDRRPKVKLTKMELRQRNLSEIFEFYCKQQYQQNVTFSFERLLHESHVINVSNFILFCKQFNITNYNTKLVKKQLPLLFKKSSSNYKEMDFQEFKLMCEKIALLMFEENNEFLSDFDKTEAFYKFIGIDNPNFYRKHMHLLNPAFNIQDKDGFRGVTKDQGKKDMVKIDLKLKEELEKRKKERDFLIKKYISLTPQPLKKFLTTSKVSNLNMPQSQTYGANKSNKLNLLSPAGYQEGYFLKNQKNSVKDLPSKITWQQLSNIQSQQPLNQKFRPTDLFDEHNDQDDQQYLQGFNLQEDRAKKMQQQQRNKILQENYGSFKSNLRPSEKYMYSSKLKGQPQQYQQYSMQDPAYGQSQGLNRNLSQQFVAGYGSNSNYGMKNNSMIGQNYMQRANEVEMQQKRREQEMVNSLNSQQNQYNRRY